MRLRIATEKENILYSAGIERDQKHEEEEEKVLLELAADDISSSLSNLKIATPEEERGGAGASFFCGNDEIRLRTDDEDHATRAV